MMRVMPQTFFENDQYKTILRDGLSGVVYKEVSPDVSQKEGYVSIHAITLVLQGELRIENINKGVAHVKSNQLIFIPKGLYTVSDIIHHPRETSFKALMFFFDEQLVDEFLKAINPSEKFPSCTPHLTMPYSEPIRVYTETLLKLYHDGRQHHAITRAKLFELLHLISVGEHGEAFIKNLLMLKSKQKRNLKDFMSANFDKSLSVEDYAYLTGRSLSTFNRDFKRQFKVSPKKWLMEKRLEKAQLLLMTNPKNVADVASGVGYENFSHFIKAFHKKFGISPKQFVIQKRNEVMV